MCSATGVPYFWRSSIGEALPPGGPRKNTDGEFSPPVSVPQFPQTSAQVRQRTNCRSARFPNARQDYLVHQLQKLNPGSVITITPPEAA
jgi:hypothetical protein